MTTYQAPRARRNIAARTSPETSRLINALHAEISNIIIDPTDSRAYERADDLCQEIWQWCTSMGDTPWKFCLDRYCSCKVMLSEWEPQTLPFDVGGGRNDRA